MNVTLRDARESSRTRAVLRRLFPMYIHDLSPHTTFYTLDARGRWRPELWRDWLSMETLEPWLFESDGAVSGFAVIGHQPFPYMSPDRNHKVCEFFVLSNVRKRGVGRAAATSILNLHAGAWELTVLPTNAIALSFWTRVVGERTGGRFEAFQLPGEVALRFQM